MTNTRKEFGLTEAYGTSTDNKHVGIFTPAYHVRHRRLTGWFNILVGVNMIVMWSLLIYTGQVTDLADHIVSYGFHWVAELGTALMLIASGYLMLKERPGTRRLYYLAAGLVFNAVSGAVVHYTVYFDAGILAMTGIITMAVAALAYLNRGSIEDLSSFSIGAVMYGAVNVAGNILDALDYTSLSYIVLVLVFGSVLFLERLRNRA